jgi:hypothetical protein
VSEEAQKHFQKLAERYLSAGSPERASWYFDNGEMTELHRELESAGLAQRTFGTVGGFAWRLTEAGVERANQLGAR